MTSEDRGTYVYDPTSESERERIKARETKMELKEYKPGERFPGVVGRTVDQSSPAWPEPLRARKGAPNVLFFGLGGVGYGQPASFGELINTPTLDRLAENDPCYTNVHTGALIVVHEAELRRAMARQ